MYIIVVIKGGGGGSIKEKTRTPAVGITDSGMYLLTWKVQMTWELEMAQARIYLQPRLGRGRGQVYVKGNGFIIWEFQFARGGCALSEVTPRTLGIQASSPRC